jgi:hypothetical protein
MCGLLPASARTAPRKRSSFGALATVTQLATLDSPGPVPPVSCVADSDEKPPWCPY